MEPRGPVDSHEFPRLQIDALRRAVEIYLASAYPTSQPPEPVRRRLHWAPDADPATLLMKPPFERSRTGEGSLPVFALRLGNASYPHMKLQVQPWPNADGYIFSVNTHDQILSVDLNANDAEAFRALQVENQRIKEAIENAWDQAGLPTFLRYLRDYIASRTGAAQPESAGPGPS